MRLGLEVRRGILDLVDLMWPVDGALWAYATGMQQTKLAGVLVTSGLADALGRDARHPHEVARERGLDPDVTARLLRGAAGARLVRFDRRGRARLSRLGAGLRRDHPRSMASWVAYQASEENARAHLGLEAQLREGAEPSGHRRAFGNSIWEYLRDHPEEHARYDEAMRETTGTDLPALVRAYPWPRDGVVCDVAGGNGALLAAILKRRPRARGILVDAPEVVARAEGFLREQGVADRVERRPGNFFENIDARADVYALKWILHDWSDDACRTILRNIRAAMRPGARLVVIDMHNDPRRSNLLVSMTDLLVMVGYEGGRERSPDEVHALMSDAGLTPGRVRHSVLYMLVEGVAR